MEDVQRVMNVPSYDDTSAYSPLYKMGCSYHPQWRNQVIIPVILFYRTLKCLSVAQQELVQLV